MTVMSLKIMIFSHIKSHGLNWLFYNSVTDNCIKIMFLVILSLTVHTGLFDLKLCFLSHIKYHGQNWPFYYGVTDKCLKIMFFSHIKSHGPYWPFLT